MASENQNMFAKVGQGFSSWLGNLSGRPKTARKNLEKEVLGKGTQMIDEGPITPTASPPKPEDLPLVPSTEDSVVKDFQGLLKVIGVYSKKMSDKVSPAVNQGIKSAQTSAAGAIGGTKKGSISVMLKILAIAVVIVLLVMAGLNVLKTFDNRSDSRGVSDALTSTPTPVEYKPTKNSVYANDASLLKLEEEINVLTREISGSNLKESQLSIPALDFNISF